MRLGFIGLGTMGAPMVHNLAASGIAQSIAICDSRRDAAEALGDLPNVRVANGPAEVGAMADVVITMLPNGDIVRDVVTGAGGLAEGLAPGSVVIDMSSSYPASTRQLGAALAEKGITLVDAPVSGGLRKAISGKLAIMLGCDDPEVARRVAPVLAALGDVIEAGPLGSGHAAKALNNYVSAAGLVAACEALIVGQRFGIDPLRLTEILNASTGRNNSTENKLAQFIVPGRYADAGFALSLMAKDVRAAADMARESGMTSARLDEMARLWTEADRAFGPGADHTAIHKLLGES